MFSKSLRVIVAFSIAAFCFGLLAIADKPDSSPQNRIRQALEGKTPDNSSGDGVLDDVIGVINQQGSILDGSSLDDRPIPDLDRTSSETSRAIAAEQLLKASRLLEKLGRSDKSRRVLVKQMRGEAAKLVSE
jgi:hypothetical protein